MKTRMLSPRYATLAAVTLSTTLLPVATAHAADEPAPQAPRVTSATTDTFGRMADAVLTDRTAALLDEGQAPRTALKATGGARLSAAVSRTEGTALTALRDTRSRLAAFGEAYTDADTDVTVDSTQVRGQQATVRVTETTTLTYAKLRGDEPATTGFRAHHELTFTAQPDGTWQLSGLRTTDNGPRPINDPAAATSAGRPGAASSASRAPGAPAAPVSTFAIIDAPKAATTLPAPAKPKKLTGGTYDYAAMATYTEKYWKDYNPAYRKYNSLGGDCTNYLSQGLLAGGWKQISTVTPEEYDTWYYASNGTADAWIGVNEWSWFTQTAKRTTPLANVYQMDVGDVMQIDFNKDGSKDHSMMTTYRSSSGVPYLTYHDADTYRRSVASIIAQYPTSVYFAYRT
ncbi:amidase domain-containing protein [Streptomyces bluensis]|uniref:Amidase domain-containing protein n=1 Tax=Streptomyces bluensis TaxID=33897 RepID=A0ABW6UI17_9ACTN